MQVRTSTGIHLAVPAGWSTAPGADGSLRVASAPGHVVLRAELRRHVGMPSAEALRSGFTSGLKRLRLRRETRVETPGFLALRFAVGAAVDAGLEEEVFLSATALGDDTLLCNSLRGTSSADLEVLLRACREAGGPDAGI